MFAELDSVILSDDYFRPFVMGILNTLTMFVIAWFGAITMAFLLAVIRSTESKIAQVFVVAYVEYHRNVPLLVQIFLWYFALSLYLPRFVDTLVFATSPEMFFATVALALYSAAYMSEDIRSGIRAVPEGQYEAAKSIAMSHYAVMRYIVMPQALRHSVPPLVSQTLVLFKATSIASAIGAAEMTYQARYIESQTFRVFEAFAAVTALYMLGCFAIMYFGNALAQRTKLESK